MGDVIRDYYRIAELFHDDLQAVSIAIIRIGVDKPKRVLNDLEELKLSRYEEHIKTILSDPLPHLKNMQLTFFEYFDITGQEPL